MNFSAISHRALFARTNDTDLRCKQEPVGRWKDFSSVNSKFNSKPKDLKQVLVHPRLSKHHLRGKSMWNGYFFVHKQSCKGGGFSSGVRGGVQTGSYGEVKEV